MVKCAKAEDEYKQKEEAAYKEYLQAFKECIHPYKRRKVTELYEL